MNLFLQIASLLFGLMPFNRTEADSNLVVDYSIIFIMPVFYLFCYYYVNYQELTIYNLKECASICNFSGKLLVHLGCFLYLTIYFLTLLRQKKFYIEFGKRLLEIDELTEKCIELADNRSTMTVTKKKRLFYITWAFILGTFAFAIFYDVRHVFKYFGPFCFYTNMVITFPYVTGSLVQGMFASYISEISARFAALNLLFEKINNESEKKNSPIAVMDIENDTRKESSKVGPAIISDMSRTKTASLQKKTRKSDELSNSDSDFGEDDDSADDAYSLSEYDETRTTDGKTSETNLPSLFKLHDKILSLSVLVNAEFGAQCVPYMAACFVITIFGIFLVTKVMFIVGGKNQLLDYVIYLYVIWSFTTMMVGYFVLRLCCNTNAHSKQSAMLVHEIMQKKPAFMLGNDIYYNKMKAFTLQFLHWEGYFQFNGIGLFALDYTFIFSTVSAATSYLIVLLQFDMTSILKTDGLTPRALTADTAVNTA
ncbi:gustatory and pheromone receptor 33a [Zeugodacus cucurbitae]|uniref:gustatory and pheromone receptor 33a n=1 Tax=Zeugodacus cucurbitae TaxID=28588 RepID=UPI0010A74AEF|nr:gustatory and pheromone receptor 33a [Zeugodacus cucurbitae]